MISSKRKLFFWASLFIYIFFLSTFWLFIFLPRDLLGVLFPGLILLKTERSLVLLSGLFLLFMAPLFFFLKKILSLEESPYCLLLLILFILQKIFLFSWALPISLELLSRLIYFFRLSFLLTLFILSLSYIFIFSAPYHFIFISLFIFVGFFTFFLPLNLLEAFPTLISSGETLALSFKADALTSFLIPMRQVLIYRPLDLFSIRVYSFTLFIAILLNYFYIVLTFRLKNPFLVLWTLILLMSVYVLEFFVYWNFFAIQGIFFMIGLSLLLSRKLRDSKDNFFYHEEFLP